MASGIRVECCPDPTIAAQRQATLEALGYQVEVIAGPMIVFTSQIAVNRNQVNPTDTTVWTNAAVVVVGVLRTVELIQRRGRARPTPRRSISSAISDSTQ